MDSNPKFEQWLKTMGYDGEICDSVKKFLKRPDVNLLFSQLVTKVKPKQEIIEMKKNVLLHQLKNDVVQYPMEELCVYNKRKEVETKVKEMEAKIREDGFTLGKLQMQNKMEYVKIETMKQNIQENNRRTFLYKAKADALKEDIETVREKIEHVLRLTPTTADDSVAEDKVLHDLEVCAEKLEELLENQKTPTENSQLQQPGIQMSMDESLGILQEFEMGDYILPESELKQIDLRNEAAQILHGCERAAIWKTVNEMNENVLKQLAQVTIQGVLQNNSNPQDSVSLTRLYGEHIKNKLLIKKCQKGIEILRGEYERELQKFNAAVDSKFGNGKESEHIKTFIDNQEKTVTYDGLISFLQAEIGKQRVTAQYGEELRKANEENMKIKKQIASVSAEVEEKIKRYKYNHDTIQIMRENFGDFAKTMGQLAANNKWSLPLRNKSVAREIRIFADFPLEYNRSFMKNNTRTFYRNLCSGVLPPLKNLDRDTIFMLLDLIESPAAFPERIFERIRQRKAYVEEIKQLKCSSDAAVSKDVCQSSEEDLQHEAEALKEFFNSLQSEDYSSEIKETVSTWMQTSFGNCISTKRTFKGLPFSNYKSQFDKYFNIVNRR